MTRFTQLASCLLLCAFLLVACRKKDNARLPDLEKVNVPLLTMGPASGRTIPVSDPAAFTTSVVVDIYFKDGDKPKQMDLVVIKNGDKSNTRLLHSGITTFPTTVTITGQQLRDLFGTDILLNDVFTIGADVTTRSNRTYEAFPPIGIPYGQNVTNLPGASVELTFTCADFCLYDPAAFSAGEYEVIIDEWGDYAAGDSVTLTKIDDTHFSFDYLTDDAVPIVIAVDAVTNEATVESVMYGSYDLGAPNGSVKFTAKGITGSIVNPCDTSFHLVLNHEAEGFGDQGNYVIELKK